ncbi:hypothetical protein AB0N29_07370 [Nocardioides sp. NPDC092400]|uniref:hypothetical protein n=1 Tax=Nocardioides sp. NPDC092400 TaxID=3155196 RepID=UPI0034447A62
MTHRCATALRGLVTLVLGVLALWALPGGGQLTFAGTVLAGTALLGLVTWRGRALWYVLGAGLVVAGLFLGLKDGPFGAATTGYCGSLFSPGRSAADDAPRGTYVRCEETRRERLPIVAGLGLLAVAALAASAHQPEIHHPRHASRRTRPGPVRRLSGGR